MKKLLYGKTTLLLLLLFLTASMTGCSSGVSQDEFNEMRKERDQYKEKYEDLLEKSDNGDSGDTTDDAGGEKENKDDNDASKKPAGTFAEDKILDQLDIQEYLWSTKSYNYATYIVKNNSEFNLHLEANVLLYKGDDLVGSKKDSLRAFEAGQEMSFTISDKEKFDKAELEFTPQEESYYEPVISNVEYDINETDSKLIFTGKNNNDYEAEFLQYTIIYFKGDEVVNYNTKYFSSNKMAPGETDTVEVKNPRESFDSYKVFLSGKG